AGARVRDPQGTTGGREVKITQMSPDELTPYEGNPRKITGHAVDRVAESIERYGWQQPIVVDAEHVVLVGHTRLQAAQQLGLTEVPVHVADDITPEQARAYRLADNRTGELSQWDHEALALEAREFPDELVETFFPDVDLEIESIEAAQGPTDEDVADAADRIGSIPDPAAETTHTTEVECPACYEAFSVRTATLPGVTSELLRELIKGGDEN